MSGQYYFRREIVEIFECDEAFLYELEREDLIRTVMVEAEQETVYPPETVERIRIIRNLMDLEVNLAGVEVIMTMRDTMIQMQKQFDEILATLVQELKHRM